MKPIRNIAPAVVTSNIRSVVAIAMEQALEERRNIVDRIADAIGGFSGSMTFVAIHVVWFVSWFVINTGLVPGVPRFDPYPFILLAMIVSVEGVLLSTFVLMKQNRMQKRIDVRDQLNLQIDLLAEKEVTKSLQLLRAVCKKLEIEEVALDSELHEMAATTFVDMLAQQVQSELPECH
ncbi:MAG: DUF1003 domain-containing protein [Acidobacteriales bacterium]|nr:DUF1003 domain-containing protein [Terriglobales bacterium]